MPELVGAEGAEQRLPGPVPRWEVPGWRERFGVVAGVTGRGEGDGFDLGLWTSRPVGEVSTRWREFLRAEPGFASAVLSHQIHGTQVAWSDRPTAGWTIRGGVDGHLTREPGVLLLVTVADCIPVYLVDPKRRLVALLHAGWRGVAGRILARGVEALAKVGGSSPADLVMHCGVGISGPCYEVGSEVLLACGKLAGEAPANLDLRSLLREQGASLGILEISVSSWCTSRDAERFFSHRRSGGRDGRQVAYLGWPRDDHPATIL
jgi:YfiH family protein